MTLFLASEIARIYDASGRHEMALKFFERIAKTYRKENWPAILSSVLTSSVRCAELLDRRTPAVESLFELLSDKITPDLAQRQVLWDRLMVLLRQPGADPSSTKISIDMDSVSSFLQCGVQFKKANAYVGSSTAFQVTISGSTLDSPARAFRLSRMRVAFSNPRMDQVWNDAGEEDWSLALISGAAKENSAIQWVDCTNLRLMTDPDVAMSEEAGSLPGHSRMIHATDVDLRLAPGCKKVFEGSLIPTESEDLKIVSVSLVLEMESTSLSMIFRVGDRHEDTSTRREKLGFTLLDGYGEQSTIRVIPRQPNVTLTFKHSPPGYLDEIYPISIDITNEEDNDVEGTVEVEFRASTADSSDPSSTVFTDPAGFDEERLKLTDSALSQSGSVSLDIGVVQAHQAVSRQLWLRATRNVGERLLLASLNYRVRGTPPQPAAALTASAEPQSFRKAETLRIPFARGLEARFEATFRANSAAAGWGEPGVGGGRFVRELSETGLLSEDGWDVGLVRHEGWALSQSGWCAGPWDVEVRRWRLVEAAASSLPAGVEVHVRELALPNQDAVTVWKSGQNTQFMSHVTVSYDFDTDLANLSVGTVEVEWRRKSSEGVFGHDAWVRSLILVPPLDLTAKRLWAHVDLPDDPRVGQPFALRYAVQNGTLELADLQATVEPSDAFVFAGHKQCGFRVPPLAGRPLVFNCVPLTAGRCALPRLRIVRRRTAAAAADGDVSAAADSARASTSSLASTTAGGARASVTTAEGDAADDEAMPVYATGGCGRDGELVVFVKPSIVF
ncbi:hypothetical protein HK405_013674 [Cladochytrium tenue]|nr:hypothetical protein HK405_013674 [Cladochytrium tenue]